MWQDLARVLALLITKYQKLQELNKEKHGVLVLMKMQELEKLVQQEERLIEEINEAERQRQQAISKLSEQGVQITADMAMEDVWSQCRDKNQREMLYKLHKMLAKLVKDVQETVANNEILITSALDTVNFRLNQLGGSVVEPTYGSRGQEQVIHRKNFDLEV